MKSQSATKVAPPMPNIVNVGGANSFAQNKNAKNITLNKESLNADFNGLQKLLESLPIPPKEGWERVKISQIAEAQSGGTPSRQITEYWNGTINWIKSEACQNCYVYENQVTEKITELGLKKSSAKILKKNSVLVALVGATIGKIRLSYI